MKAQHTPGPWYFRQEFTSVEVQNSQGYNQTIADCGRSYVIPDSEAKANARLIAAAPELLDVCERLYKLSGENGVALNLSALAEFQDEVFRLTAKVIAKTR